MTDLLLPLIIPMFLGLVFGSIITYYVVRASVKDALKQSEYYLEIIAKNNIR
ncbi:hypothetical protein [Chryseobacterium sp. Mn2064]|uniref:hypothetical protein n=1 Tax=Chryseobacterium sp. Mn2064 TaxID=3395263 RepID=UPI003BEA48CF